MFCSCVSDNVRTGKLTAALGNSTREEQFSVLLRLLSVATSIALLEQAMT